MMLSKGEIWLVNLNPVKKNNEMGKIIGKPDEISGQIEITTIYNQ